jgi:hypothetical protein
MKNMCRVTVLLACVLVCMPDARAWCHGCGGGYWGGDGWGVGAGIIGASLVGSAIAASANRPRVIVEQRVDNDDEVQQLRSENKRLRRKLRRQPIVEEDEYTQEQAAPSRNYAKSNVRTQEPAIDEEEYAQEQMARRYAQSKLKKQQAVKEENYEQKQRASERYRPELVEHESEAEVA